ncbi:hypothetical protein AZI86_03195 [Bdellovibrio bacteriovorus]|uniref:ASP external chaperone domain-containing protein n=1 Tax=Bdellovibrio bacteriovorus TaxID=959 RepID=A0A150WNZ6_BDEBC|nr:hypothetical protein [Bdellovibrio bacteriovorus]KYG66086.1 hypothetical protein AZI86_03195 [Bdellovibrio bacteriovorus]
MLSARSILFAAAILIGYFYFLSSEYKDRTLDSMAKLIQTQDKYHPIQPPPQKIEMASQAPAEPPAPAGAVQSALLAAAIEQDKAKVVLPPQEEALEHLSPSTEQLRRYATNDFFIQGQGSFQVLRLRAISKYSYTEEMGTVIDQKMNLVFFDPSESSATAKPMTFPVVMKSSNGQLGILSGTLLVTMKDIQQAGLLAQRFGLALKAQDNSLGLAYLGAPRADEVSELINSLRQDPAVKSVEAEIVQNWKKR